MLAASFKLIYILQTMVVVVVVVRVRVRIKLQLVTYLTLQCYSIKAFQHHVCMANRCFIDIHTIQPYNQYAVRVRVWVRVRVRVRKSLPTLTDVGIFTMFSAGARISSSKRHKKM